MLNEHSPVLCSETIEALHIDPNGVYLDATFGRGGHSRAILQQLGPKGRLIALDRDPEALQSVAPDLAQDPRFKVHYLNFSNLDKVIEYHHVEQKVQGILLDIGVSSPQLDNAHRGFSFQTDGPLDMRMDPTQGFSAAEWLANASEQEMLNVLWTLGEEPFAKRIVRAIMAERVVRPITQTSQLATLVKEAIPRSHHVPGKNPATQTFQAIRILVNDELGALTQALEKSMRMLAPKGRLCVITFHSLEDRIVKRFFKDGSQGTIPKGIPLRASEIPKSLNVVVKRIRPSLEEVARNPRARSATLRVAEKI